MAINGTVNRNSYICHSSLLIVGWIRAQQDSTTNTAKIIQVNKCR